MFELVLVILVSQIIILSVYFPARMHRYSKELIRRYPESEYPLLYTLGTETRVRRRNTCSLLNAVVAVICLSLLVGLLIQGATLNELMKFWVIFLLIQIIPLIINAYWEAQVNRLRAKMPKPTVRKASLEKRGLNQLVPPFFLYAFVGVVIVSIVFSVYLVIEGILEWRKFIILQLINLLVAIFILWRIYRNVHNPRVDPYAAGQNEFNRAKLEVRMLVTAGLAATLTSLLGLTKSLNWLSPETILLIVTGMLSILMQVLFIYLAHRVNKSLDTVDYNVYRQKSLATQ